MIVIFIGKNGKIHLKMCKTSNFKIFFPCLYNFTLPKYLLMWSGSSEKCLDSAPDPTGSGFWSWSATLPL